MDNYTVYELPLNEKIRTFLRLEYLFNQALYFMRGFSVWDSRVTIDSLQDIISIMTRIDLRSELLKELERQSSALMAIAQNPEVDASILRDTLETLSNYGEQLKLNHSSVKSDLRDLELIKSIRQRDAIPGGTCDFDIPGYHFWLKQPAEERIKILELWMRQLTPYRQAIVQILNLLRESASLQQATAKEGFYQQSLDTSVPYQLIRVLLAEDARYYAEISGGRHRFSIRFMRPNENDRASPFQEPIEFKLACCAI